MVSKFIYYCFFVSYYLYFDSCSCRFFIAWICKLERLLSGNATTSLWINVFVAFNPFAYLLLLLVFVFELLLLLLTLLILLVPIIESFVIYRINCSIARQVSARYLSQSSFNLLIIFYLSYIFFLNYYYLLLPAPIFCYSSAIFFVLSPIYA